MRLFVAVKFTEEIVSALISVEEQLKKANIHGNYTKPENLHLTLAFIGEYPDPDHVLETLEKVSFRPFPLETDGIGSFGNIWWAGISAPAELNNTAARIRHCLADAGIPFDRKRFSPHITLIREPDRRQIPALDIPAARMTVDEIYLMRSERGKKGMIYTEVGAISASSR